MATTLAAGDIAFVGFNSDDPDEFAFVTLVDLEAGTEISFTDNGWFASGGFRATEGTFTWTAGAAIAAGTVINPSISGILLSASGDQISAYQGDAGTPTFVAAIHFDSTDYGDATTSNTTGLPTGLTVGTSALNLGETDNGFYVGPTAGSQAELQAALNDSSNWTLDNARVDPLPSPPFAVTNGGTPSLVINEVDADTAGTDAAEFVELFDGGAGNTALDGLVVVFFNGSDDASYAAFDLDGFATDADGYFVLGNAGVANVGLTFAGNTLQNGADAVAIFEGSAGDFPNDTPVTAANLIDAVVYDTNDGDDAGLLTGLGQTTQFNEDEYGAKDFESSSRVPNGTGAFVAQAPTPGAANDVIPPATARFIHEIQGLGGDSPLLGESVIIEGIVVGDFQDGAAGSQGDLNGFYVQEEDDDADSDPLTSEGVFVFDGSSPGVDVNVGDLVRITGTIVEFSGETQITAANVEVVPGGGPMPTAATITFPVAATTTNSDGELIADLEAFEGMLVTIPQELTVADLFTLGRFGDMGLHADGRLQAFTQANTPDVAGFRDFQDLAVRNTVILDDGSTVQNPAVIPFEIAAAPGDVVGQLDANDQLSAGDTVAGLTGVVRFAHGSGGSGDEIYRINPTVDPVFVNDNPREPTAPDVGGDITIASFNVLNFFTTLDDGQSRNGTPTNAGPSGLEPRGANDLTDAPSFVAPSTQAQSDPLAEFNRQVDKLLAALTEVEADIFGLVELENEFQGDQNGDTLFSIGFLADQLNALMPGANYIAIDPGQTFIDSSDAISTGVIYDANTVSIAPGTTVEILSDSDLPGLGLGGLGAVFDGPSTNRAPLAVTFEEVGTGEVFTVTVNHFKSKGSPGTAGAGDEDIGNGVGAANQTRLNAATALDAWLDTDPTGSGDDDFLIIGDLNAYAMEDPIQFLFGEGYEDQVERFLVPGEFAYSFGFPVDLGTSPAVQSFGALDHALSTPSLASQITGVAEWHINADEASAFDYNLEFRPQAQADGLFGATPFRASDHDPLVVGLDLESPMPTDTFTLQIVHASDLEGGVDAIQNAPNFAAIVDTIEDEIANTIRLSAGDNYIPGPFFGAAGNFDLRDDLQAAYQELFGEPGLTNIREGDGRVDISILNIIEFDASVVGNHEFDAGPSTFGGLIGTDIRGPDLDDVRWLGTQFPYLSANLDVSGDGDLSGLFTSDILPNTAFRSMPDDLAAAPKLAPATTIDVNGELVGVVGATTQLLDSITSNGDVTVIGPDANDMPALAAILQPVIDDLADGADNVAGTSDDINKIILVSHLQQIALEEELATLLDGVDVIIAGGSDTLLANPDDTLRPGDAADGPYPGVFTDLSGNPTAVVSTAGEYSYVGRLVITFNDDGILVDADGNPIDDASDLDPALNGPIATTAGGLAGIVGATASGLEMSEAHEVHEVPDGPATGTFDVVSFDPETLQVTITGTYAGLSSALSPVGPVDAEGNPQSAIHLHLGEAGENGAIVRNFAVTDNGDGSGSFTGTFNLTEDEANAFVQGGTYINLHTVNNPAGELRGQATVNDAFDDGTKGGEVKALTDAVLEVVTEADGNVFGETDVFLEGRREKVRTEETNLGNLTADANLAVARSVDDEVMVSLKNGGGIRAPIGVIDGTTGELLPPPANPAADKEEGEISQLDIENSLRFNNGLTLLTLTHAQLKQTLEHAVAASGPGGTPGQFAQVGGVSFSFDAMMPAGSRVQSIALIDEDGNLIQVIAHDGAVLDPDAAVRIVTLGFLADGNDGYPYPEFVAADPAFANRVDLEAGDATLPWALDGAADFADFGSEQDAFAEFVARNHPVDGTMDFMAAETPPEEDTRIQNLEVRADEVIPENTVLPDGARTLTTGDDVFNGGFGAAEVLALSGNDDMNGGFGNETLFGGAGNDEVDGGFGDDAADGGSGDDDVDGGFGDDIADGGDGDDHVDGGFGDDVVGGGDGNDHVVGGLGDDTLTGAAGDDRLDGGFDDDVLDGGAGDDLMIGGPGRNTLTGGPGSDTFVLSWFGATDTITDFEVGVDLIFLGQGLSEDAIRLTPDGAGNTIIEGTFPRGQLAVLKGVTATKEEIQFAKVQAQLEGQFAVTGAEIVDFDAETDRLFVTTGDTVEVVNISDPANPVSEFLFDIEGNLSGGFSPGDVTSVAVSEDGLIGVAVAAETQTDPGQVAFFKADGTFLGAVSVGALPDMITFTPAGNGEPQKLLVANEGEPERDDDGTVVGVDPLGAVSIVSDIDVGGGFSASVTTLDFTGFDAEEAALRADGVRLSPGVLPSVDLEPEYIAVSPDGTTAFVALQENNAFARVDLDDTSPVITNILPLGVKDHSLAGNGFDASDRDAAIAIAPRPTFGLYQPDGVASFEANGETYYITANEGDGREFDESRVKDVLLDPAAFPGAADLQDDANLGRLKISNIDGDTDNDGDFDQLFSFGSRSFSIWNESGDQVFDSGDVFEQRVAAQLPDDFFNDQGEPGTFDERSDDKGPEPEGVTVGEIDGRTYAFIGLERVGGIMIYDVTDPTQPEFEQYINSRPGEVAPEGLTFIAADDSPTGDPLLVVASEESSTIAIYDFMMV